MHHYRNNRQKYLKRLNRDACPFCNSATIANARYQDKHVYVVPNLTQYDVWELHDVIDHVMIIPNRHVESLHDLSDKERLAVMKQASDYEKQGYSVYARGVGNAVRSVDHQHTHLIKTEAKRPLFSIFIRRPYFLIKK